MGITRVSRLGTATSCIFTAALMKGKSMLLLLKVALAIASAEANNGTCCYQKIFPDGTYTLKESNSAETAAYGCDTANSCVYVKDGTNDRYCMKMGGMSVPDCELRPCEEYIVANSGIGRKPEADGFVTDCKPPTFADLPSGMTAFYLAMVDGDFISINEKYGVKNMRKWQANGPVEVINTTFPTDFPTSDRLNSLITNWGPNKLLVVGGYNYDSTNLNNPYEDVDTVFKYENGSWTKMGWTLQQKQHRPIGCTYDDRLVMIGGSIHDPFNSKNHKLRQRIEKMTILDLSNGNEIKSVSITGYPQSCVCHNGKVYAVLSDDMSINTFYTYDLVKPIANEMTDLSSKFPDVGDGKLDIFRGNLTLFGGMVGNDGNFNPRVKTMQVFDEQTGDWSARPFEFKNIDGYSYSVVVEK